jgi:hypothetical protein
MRELTQHEQMNISAGSLTVSEITLIGAGVATVIAAPLSIIKLGLGMGMLTTFVTTGFSTFGAHTIGSYVVASGHHAIQSAADNYNNG